MCIPRNQKMEPSFGYSLIKQKQVKHYDLLTKVQTPVARFYCGVRSRIFTFGKRYFYDHPTTRIFIQPDPFLKV